MTRPTIRLCHGRQRPSRVWFSLALLRRVAWTAAGTTGVSLVSQGLADHVLTNMPLLKHVAGALPGTGAVAVRLYRLAGVTAETCSPVS